MATETRSRLSVLNTPGLFAVANARAGFKRYSPTWQQYYTMRTTKKAYEESAYVSGFSFLKSKPEGTAFQDDARIQGPTKRWIPAPYGLLSRVTREAKHNDLYGIIKTASQDLGVSAAATRHYLGTRLLMDAFAGTYHTAGDSQVLCYASHTRLGGGTWSNVGSAADPSQAAIQAAIIAFEAITDHRGLKYDQKATGIVCGPAWEFQIAKILGSEMEAENNTNAKNTLKTRRKLTLTVDPEITDNRWFLTGEKNADVGLIWFDSVKPEVSYHDDPLTQDTMITIYMNCANEVNDPRSLYGVPAFS